MLDWFVWNLHLSSSLLTEPVFISHPLIFWFPHRLSLSLYSFQRPETFPTLYPFVSSLRKLSLTHPRSSISSPQHFYSALASLLESLTLLTEFTLYVPSKTNIGILTGEEETENIPNQEKEQDSQEPRLPASFLKRLMESVGNKLQRLRICGIALSNDQLGLICQSCIELNDLVIQLFEGDKVSVGGRWRRTFDLSRKKLTLHSLCFSVNSLLASLKASETKILTHLEQC